MSNKLFPALLAAGLIAVAIPALAQTYNSDYGTNGEVNSSINATVNAPAKTKAQMLEERKQQAAEAKAKKLQEMVAKQATIGTCMAAAVDKRDTSLVTAVDARETALKTALTTRRDALKAAWIIPADPAATQPLKARRDALKAAGVAWTTSAKTAASTFKKAKAAAWTQFNTDRKACGGTGATGDTSGASVDAQL